ncbi:MAG: IS5 family transposase, partial [Steroidobacteraceae bacterium]
MRGATELQEAFSIITPSKRVPKDHPIRRIKELADAELARLSPTFDEMYGVVGRPSIPPERLLKACLLIALYSVRSERQLCERLDYDLLFRFFLDMSMDDQTFDASSFAKNKERLLKHDVARLFFEGVVRQAKSAGLIAREHFTVDGTMIEAWASLKSFKRKDRDPKKEPPPDDPGNPTVNFHGEKRTNDTHQSTTDPEARLWRKGLAHEAKLSYMGNVLMENRHGLCVDISVVRSSGYAEREQALAMIDRQRGNGIAPRTLGADKAYDTTDFVARLRERGIAPHVAQQITYRRGSKIDARTTRHESYAHSQRCRKKVEEIFGWLKTVGGLRKTRYRGAARTGLW